MSSESASSPSAGRHSRPPFRPSRLSVLLLVLAAVACGKKGDPLPPLRYVPQAASDLEVKQQGSELVVRVAYPKVSVDGLALPGLEAVELWQLDQPLPPSGPPVAVDPRLFAAGAKLAHRISGPELAAGVLGDHLQLRLPWPPPAVPRAMTFGVRFLDRGGERSELSNLVALAAAPPPPPPTGLALEGTAGGVQVRWAPSPGAGGYRVYRRLAAERGYGPPLASVAASETSHLDASAAFDNRYVYAVTAVAEAAEASESTFAAEREVDYRDRFPPAAPTAPIALAEPGRIRLSWTPNAEAGVAGYHVYRRDSAAGPSARNELSRLTRQPTTETSFLSEGLSAGRAYAFRVTAVDATGNESAPSPEVEAVVPP